MGFSPRMLTAPCPACHSICGGPVLRSKGWIRRWHRLECACGVTGAWQYDRIESPPWNVAAKGWELMAGKVKRPPPPRSGSVAVRAPLRQRRDEGSALLEQFCAECGLKVRWIEGDPIPPCGCRNDRADSRRS